MSDINFSNAIWAMLIIGTIFGFLFGFIPGFYFSFLTLIRLKQNKLFSIIVSFIIGILLSRFGESILEKLNNVLSPYSKSLAGIILLVTVTLELLLVAVHFFYFRKRKLTRKKKKI